MSFSLSVAAIAGVLLSAGFVYLEVGRFAAPQVAVSRFDERKEIFAYTAGLFVGVPVAVPFLFFLEALGNAALLAAFIDLAIVVAGVEVAEWLLLRSRYFGRVPAASFYALGMQAGLGGILVLTLVARYLGGPSIDAVGAGAAAVDGIAVVWACATAALLALPPTILRGASGGPIASGIFLAVAFLLVGTDALLGPYEGLFGALVALAGSAFLYLLRLRPLLDRAEGGRAARTGASPASAPSRFGRKP